MSAARGREDTPSVEETLCWRHNTLKTRPLPRTAVTPSAEEMTFIPNDTNDIERSQRVVYHRNLSVIAVILSIHRCNQSAKQTQFAIRNVAIPCSPALRREFCTNLGFVHRIQCPAVRRFRVQREKVPPVLSASEGNYCEGKSRRDKGSPFPIGSIKCRAGKGWVMDCHAFHLPIDKRWG